LLSIIIYTIFFVLYILFILDLKFFYLPIGLNIFLGIIGITTNTISNLFIDDSNILSLGSSSLSILGYSAGFLSLWSVNFAYKSITKKHGIGGGDFILFAGLGSIVGPLALAPILFLGSISALLIVLTNLKKYSNEVPLGSGLILGFIFYVLLRYFELLANMPVI
jgi:leader peptidase (prepilin peptidase)/N-methyltransferase